VKRSLKTEKQKAVIRETVSTHLLLHLLSVTQLDPGQKDHFHHNLPCCWQGHVICNSPSP